MVQNWPNASASTGFRIPTRDERRRQLLPDQNGLERQADRHLDATRGHINTTPRTITPECAPGRLDVIW